MFLYQGRAHASCSLCMDLSYQVLKPIFLEYFWLSLEMWRSEVFLVFCLWKSRKYLPFCLWHLCMMFLQCYLWYQTTQCGSWHNGLRHNLSFYVPVFVHLKKAVIIYWIMAHKWCMLLCLHLVFASAWSQPLLSSFIKPRAKPGFVHPLGWASAVALKTHTQCWCLQVATSILTGGCFSKAFKEQLLCHTKRSAPKIKKHCDNSL